MKTKRATLTMAVWAALLAGSILVAQQSGGDANASKLAELNRKIMELSEKYADPKTGNRKAVYEEMKRLQAERDKLAAQNAPNVTRNEPGVKPTDPSNVTRTDPAGTNPTKNSNTPSTTPGATNLGSMGLGNPTVKNLIDQFTNPNNKDYRSTWNQVRQTVNPGVKPPTWTPPASDTAPTATYNPDGTIDDTTAKNMRDQMQTIVTDRTKEGYFVRNPGFIKKVWNNFGGGYLAPGRLIENLGGWKGGQCGEFGEWGMEWSKDMLRNLFGPEAVVTDIVANRNQFINHRATRVVLPNGERYVLDYWESMQTGKPMLYTEKDWVEKWRKNLGGATVIETSEMQLNAEEQQFRDFLRNPRFTEEQAIEMFIRSSKSSDPTRIRSIILNYRRNKDWLNYDKPPAYTPAPSTPMPVRVYPR